MAPQFLRLLLIWAAQFHWCLSDANNHRGTGEQHNPQGHRHVVPLHRQRVPVQNEDGLITMKSVYFGNVFVGTPEQKFTVMFDTGSGHVIVPSVACQSEACTVHSRYDRRLSSTAVEIGADGAPVKPDEERDQLTVAFGTGEVTGEFARDRVCLGLQNHPEHTSTASPVQNQAQPGCLDMHIIAATEMSDEPFATMTFDGVVGLGLDGLALAPEFSFMDMIVNRGNLAYPTFGIYLASNEDDFSEISFGGPNPARVKSDIAWAPVALPELGHWQVKVSAVRVGGKTFDFCSDGTCRAVVDSGTSTLAVPSGLFDALRDALDESLRVESSHNDGPTGCASSAGQTLEFDVDDVTLSLGPGDYARPSVRLKPDASEAEEDAAMAALERQGSAQVPENGIDRAGQPASDLPAVQCHAALMPIQMAEPLGPKLFILGEPLLRRYYTTYDWQQKRIGFAVAAHGEEARSQPEKPRRPLLVV